MVPLDSVSSSPFCEVPSPVSSRILDPPVGFPAEQGQHLTSPVQRRNIGVFSLFSFILTFSVTFYLFFDIFTGGDRVALLVPFFVDAPVRRLVPGVGSRLGGGSGLHSAAGRGHEVHPPFAFAVDTYLTVDSGPSFYHNNLLLTTLPVFLPSNLQLAQHPTQYVPVSAAPSTNALKSANHSRSRSKKSDSSAGAGYECDRCGLPMGDFMKLLVSIPKFQREDLDQRPAQKHIGRCSAFSRSNTTFGSQTMTPFEEDHIPATIRLPSPPPTLSAGMLSNLTPQSTPVTEEAVMKPRQNHLLDKRKTNTAGADFLEPPELECPDEFDPDVDMVSTASGDSPFEAQTSQTRHDADADDWELEYVDDDGPVPNQRDLDECEGKFDIRKANVAEADV